MKRSIILVLLMASSFVYAERDLTGISITIPTQSDAERQMLARQLILMVFTGPSAEEAQWRGSAVLMGMDNQCLYAATANHLLRGGAPEAVWVQHGWSGGKLEKASVLAPHDASLDVGVLCIAEPQKRLFPLPRFPFYLRGSVRELVTGDVLVSIGHGGAVSWRTSTAVTFVRIEGDLLAVRGGDIQAGDSGGGLFSREAAFEELVGMILHTNEGSTTAVSVDAIGRLFKTWKLPFDLHDWDFREVSTLEVPMLRAAFRNVDGYAPPRADGRARVNRLMVSVSGGPLGGSTGLLLGLGDGEAVVGVPWDSFQPSGDSLTVTFDHGLTLPASYQAAQGNRYGVLRVPISAVDQAEMLQLSTGSPLATQYVGEEQLAVGRRLYLAGIDSNTGGRQILPRDHVVREIGSGFIVLDAPAVSRASLGWAAFDDNNNLVGLVSSVTDRTLTVRFMNDWMHQVDTEARLEPWQMLDAPVPMHVAGRQGPLGASCPFPRIVRYGGEEIGQGLVRLGNTVVFSALTISDYVPDAYVSGFSLDGKLKFVRRSDSSGRKFNYALAVDPRSNSLIGGLRLNQDPTINARTDPQHCGLLETMTQDGRISSKQLSCKVPLFLPDAIYAEGDKLFSGGSILEVQDDAVVASLAAITNRLSTNVLATDSEVNSFVGITHAPGDDLYVAGHGVNLATSSQDMIVARYSKAGHLRWKRLAQVPQHQEDAAAVVPTNDGGVIAVASSFRHGDSSSEVILWRYSESGDLIWKKTFGGAGVRVLALDATDDGHGGVLVAGEVEWHEDVPAVPIDGWLLAVDGAGNLRWQKTYSPKHVAVRRSTALTRVVRDGDGFWVLARSNSSGTLFGSILMRVDAHGDLDTSMCQQ